LAWLRRKGERVSAEGGAACSGGWHGGLDQMNVDYNTTSSGRLDKRENRQERRAERGADIGEK
jgi:hypothetical protein